MAYSRNDSRQDWYAAYDDSWANTPYVYGSAAYEEEEIWVPEVENRRRVPARKNTRKTAARADQARMHRRAARMNAAGVLGMIVTVAIICLFLVQYISLQARVTAASKEIASLESELTAIRQANDETLNAINASISLDQIKYTAITKLGMTYASKNQIYTYEGDASDYVHQVKEVGN